MPTNHDPILRALEELEAIIDRMAEDVNVLRDHLSQKPADAAAARGRAAGQARKTGESGEEVAAER